jgi:anti-sigma regulatory factor (Ser/Thr protein kinase)
MAVRERVWSLVVPHSAGGARQARQQLAADLHDLIPPALLADAVAVVAELLGNAIRHAAPLPGNIIRLNCRACVSGVDVVVRLEVTDGGSTLVPVARPASTESVDGRGLAIVSALARSWGVERGPAGQCVWAELAIG